MEPKIKTALFTFLFIVLLLPFVQQCVPFIDSGKLYGYYTNAPDVHFTIEKWMDGSYQKEKSAFCNDHVGFRPDLLRVNGQIDFSLFHSPDYGGIVMDKDGSLYYDNYIKAYFGEDFTGRSAIKDKLVKLKAIQDTLDRIGKSLVLVYTPSKAYYNAGAMAGLRKYKYAMPNNYATFVHTGDSLGIHQVDLNAWFVQMKPASKELLFSKQGIHWTVYGSILAADSVIRYVEQLRHIHMVHPVWTKVEHTRQARQTDNDIASVLNLIFPVANETFCYPELQFTGGDTSTTRPAAIYLGDSFVWTIITSGILTNINSKWEFWDYFRDTHRDGIPDEQMPQYNWQKALDSTDYIVLMYNSINLPELGNGFIEQAYQHYYPAK